MLHLNPVRGNLHLFLRISIFFIFGLSFLFCHDFITMKNNTLKSILPDLKKRPGRFKLLKIKSKMDLVYDVIDFSLTAMQWFPVSLLSFLTRRYCCW